MRKENTENLYYLYQLCEEAFPAIFYEESAEKVANRLMEFVGLSQDEVDVDLFVSKVQDSIDLEKFYDELDAEGIEY